MDSSLELANCQSRSEFVEKALHFYMGYLASEDITEYLSKALLTSMRGIVLRAQRAAMDERLSVLGLIFDSVTAKLRIVCERENILDLVTAQLKLLKAAVADGTCTAEKLSELIKDAHKKFEREKLSSSVSPQIQRETQFMLEYLEEFRVEVIHNRSSSTDDFDTVRSCFSEKIGELKALVADGSSTLDNVFTFCEKAFADGDELLIFVTELTSNYYSARFIGHYGCDKYYMHNKELQFHERQQDIIKRINEIQWTV